MANLSGESVATTRELDRWLDFAGGWDEAEVQFNLAGDETSEVVLLRWTVRGQS